MFPRRNLFKAAKLARVQAEMQTQAGEMTCGGESVSFSSIICVSLKCCISSHWIQEGALTIHLKGILAIFFLPVCFPP